METQKEREYMMEGDKWMEIRNYKKKGMSYIAIGQKYGLDRRTAKKYAGSDVKPAYQLKEPKRSKLHEYNV